jgi:enoyl-CoA hydratase/carnithine racemase
MSRTLETGSDDLLGRVEGRVAILTMNRPERRNAMSSPVTTAAPSS